MSPDNSDPRPKTTITPYIPIEWPIGMTIDLTKPQHVAQSFRDVLAGRRSNRSFGPLTIAKLAMYLHHALNHRKRRTHAMLQKRPILRLPGYHAHRASMRQLLL